MKEESLGQIGGRGLSVIGYRSLVLTPRRMNEQFGSNFRAPDGVILTIQKTARGTIVSRALRGCEKITTIDQNS